MPIKPFKGFARRKSSGNVLEEVENPPQTSFRVFERPSTGRKSLSDGNIITQKIGEGSRFYSAPEDDNIFAGSDGPATRNLTGGNTLEGQATNRHSSSARRSTDLQTHFDSQPPHSRNLHDIPPPPLAGALRAAGRTFSFGARFSKSPAQVPNRPSSPDTMRSRATTNSTTSTATPPKLLESEFQLGRMDDDFGNMFEGIGKHDAQEANRNSNSNASSNKPGLFSRKEEQPMRPSPISTDRSKEVEPSPYSWGSRHSEEGLLAVVDSPQNDTHSFQHGITNPTAAPPPPPHGGRRKSTPMANAIPVSTTSHRSLEKPKLAADKGLRRSVLFSTSPDTSAIVDEDAQLVTASVHSNKRTSHAHYSAVSPVLDDDDDDDTPLFNVQNTIKAVSEKRESLPTSDHHEDNIEASIAVNARLAAEYESKPLPAMSNNKIMTPSQFEHYRQQQELKRANSNTSDTEESAESDFDEEDEAEKNREIERQRRKQEAHLSVYRQQMMKVTGQQSPSPSLRPEDRPSSSTPNLTNLSLHPGNPSGSGKSSEGDDDDEVPLGILAAHGFPNRNRPPSRLMSSNSMQNLRASYQPPHLGSAGSDIGGNRTSLPVFARNLPRDPYYGAGLVNPSNRESLALGGGGGGGSVYGGPTAATGSSPALPPGGLVGVIATEERARAMRRGSPNTQAMYEAQTVIPGPPGSMGGIPRPYTMLNMNSPNGANLQAPVSATEQAQIQLSQQMSSMMQMQMQWMQQMIQLQGGQAPLSQLAAPSNLPMPFPMNPGSRPSSMPTAGGAFENMPLGYGGGSQRTMSMLDPNVSTRLNSPAAPFINGGNRPGTPGGPGYAASIAPSERSNVGLAPRYRPVSTLPAETESSSFLPLPKPWNDENRRSTFAPSSANANPPNTTVRPVSSYNRTLTAPSKLHSQVHPEDEDEDEGWADMMKKREKKRNNWKVKKDSSSFGDLLNAVH
ncbi:hypothetical protein BJY04DRAFT_84747 [Aspergillus karnatakaensis]|uniref:uncharacterized protein n=1 Tax=Aspergillus karnatakaensis TaxID=1810916 RepID=UPI003CCD68CF